MGLVLLKSVGTKKVSTRVIGGKGLWRHCVENARNAPKAAVKLVGKEAGSSFPYEEEGQQGELMVVPGLLSSLVPTLPTAYSCCESARELWSTLSKVYGNLTSISRVDVVQEGGEYSIHLGELSTLWSDLKKLRPQSINPEKLHEGRKQEKVVDLFLTFKPAYNSLLRSEKLSTLGNVGDQIRKEECPRRSFKTKEVWPCASQADGSTQGSKVILKEEDRGSMKGDHCKKGEQEHMKKSGWVLNPKLKPAKSN